MKVVFTGQATLDVPDVGVGDELAVRALVRVVQVEEESLTVTAFGASVPELIPGEVTATVLVREASVDGHLLAQRRLPRQVGQS